MIVPHICSEHNPREPHDPIEQVKHLATLPLVWKLGARFVQQVRLYYSPTSAYCIAKLSPAGRLHGIESIVRHMVDGRGRAHRGARAARADESCRSSNVGL